MYFTRYPTTKYNISGVKPPVIQTVTDLSFRLAFIRNALGNANTYYKYTIQDKDRPETLSHRVYGDPAFYWVILYANDILDPIHDWPLDLESFNRFIINKYGSIASAKSGVHHYEKVIRVDNFSLDTVNTTRFEVDEVKSTDDALDVPYDYYTGTGSLAETQSVTTHDVDGKSVQITINRDFVSYYDYENDLNEKKRDIKLVRPEHLTKVMAEFNALTTPQNKKKFIRELR